MFGVILRTTKTAPQVLFLSDPFGTVLEWRALIAFLGRRAAYRAFDDAAKWTRAISAARNGTHLGAHGTAGYLAPKAAGAKSHVLRRVTLVDPEVISSLPVQSARAASHLTDPYIVSPEIGEFIVSSDMGWQTDQGPALAALKTLHAVWGATRMSTKTPYEKYGGFSTVSRIVMRLYDKLLDDDDVGPFFDDVDMPSLIDHQTKFVSSLMGGPASFSDTHIANAHRGLQIHDAHFDRLKELVQETLDEFSIEQTDTDTVLGAFEARRDLLVIR